MSSTYLKRDISATGNQKKWTFSAWIKNTEPTGSGDRFIFSANNEHSGGGNYSSLMITATGAFRYYNYSGGSVDNQLITNRLLRDPNGWYHVLVHYDSANSTADDRIKFYINGVQETSFGTRTNPSQNYNSYVENNYRFFIGTQTDTTGSTSDFNGIMSHVYFINDQLYAPTVFGSTDSTTGEWKINTNPTYTPGTNGFLILKDGNTITDQSSNSNDFSVGAGTLTKTEDCPSNIFNTINVLYRNNVSGTNNIGTNHGNTTWYPSSATNNHSWGRSTLGWTSGKYYMEFKIEEAGGGNSSGVWMIPTELPNTTSPQGISDTAYGFQCQFSASDDNFYTVNGGSTVTTITSNVGSNPIIMMAIDADNNKMWLGHNGTWYNNNNASTTLNNSYPDLTWTPGTYGSMYQLAFQAWYQSGAYNNTYANFGNGYFGTTAVSSAGTNASNNGIFEYNVPTGFTALSTKGLNL